MDTSHGGTVSTKPLFPSSISLSDLKAGIPEIKQWYENATASKQRFLRDILDISFFKYLLIWQRRSWNNEGFVDHLVNNMNEECNAFHQVYNRSSYIKGMLKRVIRQCVSTWFKNPGHVPIETEQTLCAYMHLFVLIINGNTQSIERYLVPYSALCEADLSIEQLKQLTVAPLPLLTDDMYVGKKKLQAILKERKWFHYKFEEERVLGVYISHHITIYTQ